MIDAGVRREWRQFRLLSRDSVRRVLSAALLSRDGDPVQFAIWATAATVVAPSMYAFNQLLRYTAMGTRWTADAELVLLSDRMFFVLYGMLASALLAALVWEALLPDTTDQEVIGPLPVRPRTLAAARLTGALALAFGFAVVVAAPSGLLFAVVSTTHPAFGWLPAVVVAHLTATVAGSMSTFGMILVLRAAAALLFGPRTSERLALLLQVVVISLIVAAVFFLPAVLSWLVRVMLAGEAASMLMPPVWFAALYSWAAGTSHDAVLDGAVRAAFAIGCVAGILLPAYLLPAALIARRVRESRGARHSGVLTGAFASVARILLPHVQRRAVVCFTIISLARSHRHLLIVMTYAGAGIAIGAGRLVTAEFLGPFARPSADAAVLLLPLVLMLCLIAGLLTAFEIPTDLEANWPFRLSPPGNRTTRTATLVVLTGAAVCLPVLTFAITAAALGWPFGKIMTASAFDLTFGLVLAQMALRDWAQIPFACARALQDTVNVKWLRFLALLVVFGFIGAQVQEAALRSPRGAAIYLTVLAATAIVIGLRQHWERNRPLRFDADEDLALETLGLSDASS